MQSGCFAYMRVWVACAIVQWVSGRKTYRYNSINNWYTENYQICWKPCSHCEIYSLDERCTPFVTSQIEDFYGSLKLFRCTTRLGIQSWECSAEAQLSTYENTYINQRKPAHATLETCHKRRGSLGLMLNAYLCKPEFVWIITFNIRILQGSPNRGWNRNIKILKLF